MMAPRLRHSKSVLALKFALAAWVSSAMAGACSSDASSGGGGGQDGAAGSGGGGGSSSEHCAHLVFSHSCSYPVGSQDCADLSGTWASSDQSCGFEGAYSKQPCDPTGQAGVCVTRTCEVLWQLADSGLDATPREPIWDCAGGTDCSDYTFIGSCSNADGCIDSYASVSDIGRARTELEARCTGSFAQTKCAAASGSAACKRELCKVLHDLHVEDAGSPTPCDGIAAPW